MGRAIVREPKCFLMDEPLSNLDAKLRVEMRAVVSRLQQRLETTTVYVTHDQTEAMTLGDRVAVMRAGVLQQVAPPRELYADPANVFVAGFIGSPAMNFLPGELQAESLRTPLGEVPLHDELRRRLSAHGGGAKQVIVGIRPEHFEDAEAVGEQEGFWSFEAPIELTESLGSEIYAHFSFEGGSIESDALQELAADAGTEDVPSSGTSGDAVARVDATSSVRAGRRHRLAVDTRRLHLFDPAGGASLTRAGTVAAA